MKSRLQSFKRHQHYKERRLNQLCFIICAEIKVKYFNQCFKYDNKSNRGGFGIKRRAAPRLRPLEYHLKPFSQWQIWADSCALSLYPPWPQPHGTHTCALHLRTRTDSGTSSDMRGSYVSVAFNEKILYVSLSHVILACALYPKRRLLSGKVDV